ncbi:MAG: DUF5615 family PIN-like protein [Bacteroidota bacterium]
MKVIVDSCIWGGTMSALQNSGYDSIWVGNFLEDPGDEEILNLAYKQNRIRITLDKDFGELAIVKGYLHKGIIRIVNFRAEEQGLVCVKILEKYNMELGQGALITVDRNKTRVRLQSD